MNIEENYLKRGENVLLNKIPVLDKGYVALLDSCNTTSKLREIGTEFFGGEYPTSLESLGSMTLAIKCPLFFQLTLSKFNFKIIGAQDGPTQRDVETFRPNAGEVAASDVVTSEAIADDISRTADALIINPKAYQADGCERFVSQVNTPLSVYTTLIVSGSYSEWCELAYQYKLPSVLEQYTIAIGQIITAEWK
jgi:hypothetical protein